MSLHSLAKQLATAGVQFEVVGRSTSANAISLDTLPMDEYRKLIEAYKKVIAIIGPMRQLFMYKKDAVENFIKEAKKNKLTSLLSDPWLKAKLTYKDTHIPELTQFVYHGKFLTALVNKCKEVISASDYGSKKTADDLEDLIGRYAIIIEEKFIYDINPIYKRRLKEEATAKHEVVAATNKTVKRIHDEILAKSDLPAGKERLAVAEKLYSMMKTHSLEAIYKILKQHKAGFYDVEVVDENGTEVEYINSGDTYNLTFVCVDNGPAKLTTLGDVIEKLQ